MPRTPDPHLPSTPARTGQPAAGDHPTGPSAGHPTERGDLTVPLSVLQTPPPPQRSTGFTARAVLAGGLVAFISVLVTALIAVPLAAKAAERTSRESVGHQADLIAAVLRNRPDNGRINDELRLLTRARRLDVDVYLVFDGTAEPAGLPQRLTSRLAAGQNITGEYAVIGGTLSMVEGRQASNGKAVLVAQHAATGLTRRVLRTLWLPLLAGLTAGILAGVLLGRQLIRPLRNMATAAARLSAGDRRVRVPVQPPAEMERVAHALNGLAEALAVSEGRQREFLLSISHELRTPLTTIRGYAEALADGVVADPAATGQTMLAEAERLDRLVADLLALARLEAADFPIEMSDVDLTDLVRGAVTALGPRCQNAGVPLRAEVPTVAVPVRTDPARIRQIVDGLVENALRVVPPGSPIVLAARPDGPDRAIVEVRDGGPGLSDDDLRVAFERGALYQRYRGVRKVGSGLGLALAAGLARRLGGGIEAGHAVEGGARFTVYLPRTQG